MILAENSNLYDLLEVAADASSQEIRAAYLRAKAAFRKDSVALYTLIDESETEDLLIQIESAYQILSSPERRKEYDSNHGDLSPLDPTPVQPRSSNVVSIDRVPPMERDSDSNLLIPPTTDFKGDTDEKSNSSRTPTAFPNSFQNSFNEPTPSPSATRPAVDKRVMAALAAELADEIAKEMEWSGVFLKKVRETKNISLEELSEFTKISRTYLKAIEEENFSKLPAAVYLRGFVTHMAKVLKVPQDKAVPAYMSRYHQATQAKTK